MTDEDPRIARREIADTLVRALERRHELLDVIVESEDYDAAIENIAAHLGVSATAAEAVLRLSFDRLTRVARRRIAAELEDLNAQLSFTVREPVSPVDTMVLRPFSPDTDRDIFAARTADVRESADGSGGPAGDLDEEIRAGLERIEAEEAAWLVAEHAGNKVGMVFGDLVSGEVNVRIWIHPDYRKRGYGTAALRKSRSEMAAYFPGVPLVVRAPAAGP
ncbi:acetyltransferase domain protein [Mycolicibacterium hassiacum DSM 44199]|uniref:Acetyltransferase domain protein n=1 Tax=Mycolicibacterium hassiacum (strain DSM 44199 / CIP 105218 / JCM 12690 / 3849) TaxID=1122247 RepID=K5BK03_MYCHD|nr:GNAT family N-acetyltransferase [Mycolicibacterium hassiacum]EKF24014.1 acetyltransferase domain protein [Mycolicibacterium hassiacum DSM 44199]MDA4086304.1 acetyltransferase [Mycolicibacterium hassiacum DSM 44199]VCT90791.1 DNA gyrase subunit A [Mycolicibacterium hassiacum DSM 44199]